MIQKFMAVAIHEKMGYLISWIALFCVLVSVHVAVAQKQIWIQVYDSDTFVLPLMLRDFVNNGTIAGWDLPTNPYIFPDMLLLLIGEVVFSNARLMLTAFGIVQASLFMAGLFLLEREVYGSKQHGYLVLTLALILNFLLLAANQRNYLEFSLLSVQHFGVLVVIPYTIVLTLQLLHSKARQLITQWRFWLLCALSLMTAFSDSFFILQFTMPMLGAIVCHFPVANRYGLATTARSRVFLVAVALLISAAAGQVLRELLLGRDKLNLYIGVDPIQNIDSLLMVTTWLTELFILRPIVIWIWIGSFAVMLISFVLSTRWFVTAQQQINSNIFFFDIYWILLFVVNIGAILVTENFLGESTARYLIPVLIFPPLLGVPFFFMRLPVAQDLLQRPIVRTIFGLLFIIVIALTFPIRHLAALSYFLDDSDPFVDCLDAEAGQRGLTNGLAHYWQAHYITMLSQSGLQVAQVDWELSPYLWNNDRKDYALDFEFVVIDEAAPPAHEIAESIVIQKFGHPVDTFTCGASRILVYNRPTDIQIEKYFKGHPRLARFEDIDDTFEFYGAVLPSEIGGVNIGLSKAASEEWGNVPGLLTYGSLYNVPTGRYSMELHTYADSANTGTWTLTAFGPDWAEELFAGALSDEGKQHTAQMFTLDRKSHLVLRVQYEGHGTLFVDKIRIKRVDPSNTHASEFSAVSEMAQDAEPTLTLLHPHPGSFITEQNTDFVWQWTGKPLAQNQAFEVRVWHDTDPFHFGAHDAVLGRELVRQIDDTYILRLDLRGAHSIIQHHAGDFWWTVAIVETAPLYSDLGQEAPPYKLLILE